MSIGRLRSYHRPVRSRTRHRDLERSQVIQAIALASKGECPEKGAACLAGALDRIAQRKRILRNRDVHGNALADRVGLAWKGCLELPPFDRAAAGRGTVA